VRQFDVAGGVVGDDAVWRESLADLVRRRPFEGIDDVDVDGGLDGLELEAELLLNSGEEAGRGVGVRRVGDVVGIAELEVVASGEGCLIDDGAIEKELHSQNEVGDGGAGVDLGHLGAVTVAFLVRLGVGVGGGGQPWTAFRDLDGVDGEFAFFLMEFELKAVGKNLLEHLLLLMQVGLSRRVDGALDIEVGGLGPRGKSRDLVLIQGVGKHHDAEDALVEDGEAVADGVETLVMGVGIVGLDGGNGEGGVSVGGHGYDCHRLVRIGCGGLTDCPQGGKECYDGGRTEQKGAPRVALYVRALDLG
jgi:hypothetical protein